MIKIFKKINNPKSFSKGFSLIELIVAVSVIIIISSIALFNQARFSSDILISNMAYDIALTIRQAEVYGISSKGSNDTSVLQSEQYRVGYGLHFAGLSDGVKPDSFLNFTDVPTGPASTPGDNTQFNYKYDSSDPILSTISLTQGQKIHRFCVHPKGGNALDWNCWDATTNADKALDIVFVKPDPDAHITLTTDNNPNTDYDQAKIVIESGLGDKCRTVRVWISGQVSVDAIDPSDTTGGCEIGS